MTEPALTAAIDTNWSPENEAALIQAAQKTPALFKKLYLHWAGPVYKYLLYQVGNTDDAEDLTSQVFLKTYQEFPRYQHRGYFAAWLFTIARNTARDYFRKSGRQVSLEAVEKIAVQRDLLDQVIQTEEMERLNRLIGVLPEHELELTRLRYAAGLSYAEIGALVRRSEEASRKAISRLLIRLQSQMENDHE
jgi:RNA polymerase sigma-70 factor (ECF subfamily)